MENKPAMTKLQRKLMEKAKQQDQTSLADAPVVPAATTKEMIPLATATATEQRPAATTISTDSANDIVDTQTTKDIFVTQSQTEAVGSYPTTENENIICHPLLLSDLCDAVDSTTSPADSSLQLEPLNMSPIIIDNREAFVEPSETAAALEDQTAELDILQQLQLNDFDKSVCPVCQVEYSAQQQVEFDSHVESHFNQQQLQGDPIVTPATESAQISNELECPFCSIFFNQSQQNEFERHVYSHMGFYPRV